MYVPVNPIIDIIQSLDLTLRFLRPHFNLRDSTLPLTLTRSAYFQRSTMIVKSREVRRRRVLLQPGHEFTCIIVLLVILRSLYRCVGTTEAVWFWFRVTREFRRHGVEMLVKMRS